MNATHRSADSAEHTASKEDTGKRTTPPPAPTVPPEAPEDSSEDSPSEALPEDESGELGPSDREALASRIREARETEAMGLHKLKDGLGDDSFAAFCKHELHLDPERAGQKATYGRVLEMTGPRFRPMSVEQALPVGDIGEADAAREIYRRAYYLAAKRGEQVSAERVEEARDRYRADHEARNTIHSYALRGVASRKWGYRPRDLQRSQL